MTNKNCKKEGCDKPVRTLGFCKSHYFVFRKSRNLLEGILCEIDGCSKSQTAKRLCDKHYKRLEKYGDPNFERYGITEITKRFNLRVDFGFSEMCWEWQGAISTYGYGTFLAHFGEFSYTLAHRLSFFLHYKIHPDKLNVLHHCDNPRCVNPSHLFLGTTQDNIDDKMRKNRQAKGETQRNSKLTTEQIIEIKHRLASGERCKPIALDFNVTLSNIWYISKGKTWRHV